MPQMRFPKQDEAWRRHVEQLIQQLCVDRDRLWKTTPQTPDPEAGVPFTGPLDPSTFRFGNQGTEFLSGSQSLVTGNTGNDPASGTVPVSGGTAS